MQLKILSLIEYLDPDFFGGSGKVLFETNRVLQKQGHSLQVICRTRAGLADFTVYEGIKFNSYPEIEGNQIKKFSHYSNETRGIFSKVNKDTSFDLILIHSSAACMGLFPFLKKSNIPIIYYFHSPWNKEYEILARERGMTFCGGQCPSVSVLSAIRRRHERRYLKLASGIVNLSNSMREEMLEVHPEVKDIPKEVIPGGANHKIFFPALDQKEKNFIRGKLKLPKEDFLVISSRRLVPRTGVDMLIEAFAEMLKEHRTSSIEHPASNRGVKLILTGSGVAEEKLKQQVKDLGIADQVIFTGYVSENRLAEYYRCSDLFVMPSKELEGFGLSTVEAMASGLPVIGTDIGGIPEILSKISKDLIIPECSVDAIAGKMEEFLSKTDAGLDALHEKSIACAKANFTWEKHVEKLLDFVSRIDKTKDNNHGTL